MPIPAAPIPCCALPVPIKPPAIAIAAAIANKGFVRAELDEVVGVCANAFEEAKDSNAIANAATSATADNFDRENRCIAKRGGDRMGH